MQASPKENGYLLWLLKMQSMTIDEMMNGGFESAVESMGAAWTEEGFIKIYDEQKKTLIQDVMALLKKLNYLQWEALIMVMGEKSFPAAGRLGGYGPFINQINAQQAAYLFILAIGDLINIRGIARRISGQAAVDILNMRVRMAKKEIGAQDRDELGLLRHLKKWAESKGLKHEIGFGFENLFQGTSTGEQMAQHLGVCILDLIASMPDIMLQKFGLIYATIIPDLPLEVVAIDVSVWNFLSVVVGTANMIIGTAARLGNMPIVSHFAQPVHMGRVIESGKLHWLCPSNKKYRVPPNMETVAEVQFKVGPQARKPSTTRD